MLENLGNHGKNEDFRQFFHDTVKHAGNIWWLGKLLGNWEKSMGTDDFMTYLRKMRVHRASMSLETNVGRMANRADGWLYPCLISLYYHVLISNHYQFFSSTTPRQLPRRVSPGSTKTGLANRNPERCVGPPRSGE
jgi:hypothetical protein